MPPAIRLRRSDLAGPGIHRRRRGRGFQYVDAAGTKVDDPELLQRINELVIPPAWQDVWICPYPGGHIQATGVDARGRKQYLYHPKWRQRRDQEKFDDMVRFAKSLPAMREAVERDLHSEPLSREQTLACAVRLLDKGFFRIGSEDYAVTNETYGLATILKQHVKVREDTLLFDYPAKHGKQREMAVIDPEIAPVVKKLRLRRGGSPELLAFKRGREWGDVRSHDINEYLKEATGQDVSAKDFRTWGATVLAAVTLAASNSADFSPTKRKRLITHAVKQVAYYLGNTPAVARASYIDPRVFDAYAAGRTVPADVLAGAEGLPHHDAGVQLAVLELLNEAAPPELVRAAA